MRLDLTTTDSTATRSIVVIGAGGYGREIADIVRHVSEVDASLSLLGISDDDQPDRLALARQRLRFLGNTDALLERLALDRTIQTYIGISEPAFREGFDQLLACGATPLIHPLSSIGSGSTLGSGVIIAQGAIATTNVALGRHTHLGTGTTVAHDTTIGNFVTLLQGVTVANHVTIGNRVVVSAGATIAPGVSIGADARIGPGVTVTADVADKASIL